MNAFVYTFLSNTWLTLDTFINLVYKSALWLLMAKHR